MSLKSFDKFCEKIVNNEPLKQKEIFDERQRVMRLRFAIEALFICIGLIFVNDVITNLYQWAELGVTADLLFAMLCLLWWEIRCAAKGCMVAVSGRFAQKTSAVMSVILGVLNGMRYALEIGAEDFFIKDNKLSSNFMFLMCSMMLIVCGIFMLTAILREEKREQIRESEESK